MDNKFEKPINEVHSVLRQMAEEKKAMRQYFKQHGTYVGYSGKASFARPF